MSGRRGQRGQRKPGVKSTRAPQPPAQAKAARAAATNQQLGQRGMSIQVEERIITVTRARTGVFAVAATKQDTVETFPATAKLTMLAAHYEMWQVVGAIRMEWVPMSRQAEGTVALQWSVTNPGKPWPDAVAAAEDPSALVGTMSTTHTLRRSPRTGTPVPCTGSGCGARS